MGSTSTVGPGILYLVYWGATEPLGQALVLPSVRRLAQLGANVTLVTFEKAEDLGQQELVAAIRRDLDARGIRWIMLRYHRRPQIPAKVYDACAGWVSAIAGQLRGRTAIVHARTFVGGLMGLPLARMLGARFVYHNEGFYPDEQVDGGVWAADSVRYRIASGLEAELYARADGIIALSEHARARVEALHQVRRRGTSVIVVPSTVDLDRFRCSEARVSAPREGLRLIYSGSVGACYRLDKAARFAAVAAEEVGRVSLRVVTRADRGLVEETLRASGLARDAWSIASVSPAAMPTELSNQDAGLLFLTQGRSEHGRSPTKLGEYWACGLPVVASPNVSDTDEIVHRERVGVIVKEHSDAGYREAARTLSALREDVDLAARCRHAAENHYGLEPACDRQMVLYRSVLS